MGKQARTKAAPNPDYGERAPVAYPPTQAARPRHQPGAGLAQEKPAEHVPYFSSLEQAVEEIWPFRPYLLAVALSKVGRYCVAEEVTQEAMHNAMRGWESFRGDCRLKTWLTRIVCNKCRDHRRRQKRRIGEVALEPSLDRGSNSWWSDPVRVVENQDMRALIGGTVNRMTTKEHEAFVLVDLKGVTRQGAALRMGVTRPALRTSLHRARERLRRALENSEFQDLVGDGGRSRSAACAGSTKNRLVCRKRQSSSASPQVTHSVRPWVDDH